MIKNAKPLSAPFLRLFSIKKWRHPKHRIAEHKGAEEARRLAEENAVVAEVGRIISSTLNIEEVYERFAEEVHKLIPFDRIAINLTNFEDKTVTVAYVFGLDVPERRVGVIFPLAGSINEHLAKNRSTLFIQISDENDIQKVTATFPNLLPHFQSGIRSLISAPLLSKDAVIGVLHLRSLKQNAYVEADVKLVERVGHQIAGAIANAQLFTELNRAEQGQRKLVLQLQDALAKVKTLSGLIPICASCKKIRDDKGYWNQLETYIRERSEAEFSHGICPECSRKLYPDFFDKKEKEKQK